MTSCQASARAIPPRRSAGPSARRRSARVPKARPGLEVRVAVALELGSVLVEAQVVGEHPHGHVEGEERVRDAGVAPVEEDVRPVPDEHVPVVEVVVLDRLRELVGGELLAEPRDGRRQLAQARQLLGGERALAREEVLVERGQAREPAIGGARGEELVAVGGDGELEVGVEGKDGLPPRRVRVLGEKRPAGASPRPPGASTPARGRRRGGEAGSPGGGLPAPEGRRPRRRRPACSP